MSNKQLRADLQTALQNLATGDLRTSATALLGKLGYASHKTLDLPTEPQAFTKEVEALLGGNNLRDHMTDLELIFTMLGEASTTEIARRSDALGFDENRTSAKQGGTIAGNARKALEVKTGKKVVSKANCLAAPTTFDLLADSAPSQPIKPKTRARAKPSKDGSV